MHTDMWRAAGWPTVKQPVHLPRFAPCLLPSLACWRPAAAPYGLPRHAGAPRQPCARQQWRAAASAQPALDAPQQPQAALKASLGGVMLRQLGPGRYVAPLLSGDSQDGLPWALALELGYSAPGGAGHGPPAATQREDVFTLQHMLEGKAQVCARVFWCPSGCHPRGPAAGCVKLCGTCRASRRRRRSCPPAVSSAALLVPEWRCACALQPAPCSLACRLQGGQRD